MEISEARIGRRVTMAYPAFRDRADAGSKLAAFAVAHPDEPALDFKRHLTRLHWKYFAESLARPLTPETDEPAGPEGEVSPTEAAQPDPEPSEERAVPVKETP